MSIKSDCIISVIDIRVIRDMLTKVAQVADILNVPFTDTIGTLHLDQNYCGTKTYSLWPSYSFLTNNGSNLTLQTTNVGHTGVYPIKMTVAMQDFPMVL